MAIILHPRELLNVAGALTMARLPLAVAYPFIAHDETLALAVYLIAILTDALDGTVARWTGTASETGAFMDGWLDKIFHVNAAWALALVGTIPGWWLLLWFSREIILATTVPWYIHHYVQGETPPVHAGWVGKVTTTLLGAAFLTTLLGLATIALWLSVGCGVLGVVSGLSYWRRIRWGQWVEAGKRPR